MIKLIISWIYSEFVVNIPFYICLSIFFFNSFIRYLCILRFMIKYTIKKNKKLIHVLVHVLTTIFTTMRLLQCNVRPTH